MSGPLLDRIDLHVEVPALPANELLGAPPGESSADMLGQSLDLLLQQQPPCGRRYEVLQCAIPGSGLEHLERRFDEVVDLSPDAVVITFGHNLGFIFSADAGRLRARSLRDHSRLLTVLGAPFDGPRASPNATFASRLPRFEAFLQRAAREARRRRVGVVMTTMAGNLWIPPTSPTAERAAPALADARYAEATVGPRFDAPDAVQSLYVLTVKEGRFTAAR